MPRLEISSILIWVVDIAAGFEDVAHLIGSDGVEPATEADELDDGHVGIFQGGLGGVVETGVIGPLVQHVGIRVAVDERQPVFADDDGAEALHEAVDAVVDLWVDVVWATGEDDDRQLVDAGVLDRLVGEGLELVVVAAAALRRRRPEGFADLAAVCAETLGEVLGELLFHEFFIVDSRKSQRGISPCRSCRRWPR